MKNYTVRIGQPMAIEDADEVAVAYMNGAMSGAEQLRYARLFANAPGKLEMLKKHEWQFDDANDTDPWCPECFASQCHGHQQDCELAALLDRIGDQQ
jgi:hypothetical protein